MHRNDLQFILIDGASEKALKNFLTGKMFHQDNFASFSPSFYLQKMPNMNTWSSVLSVGELRVYFQLHIRFKACDISVNH